MSDLEQKAPNENNQYNYAQSQLKKLNIKMTKNKLIHVSLWAIPYLPQRFLATLQVTMHLLVYPCSKKAWQNI